MNKPIIQEHYDDAGDLIKALYDVIRYYEANTPTKLYMIAEKILVGRDYTDTESIPLIGFGYFTDLSEVEKKLDEIEFNREKLGKYENLGGLEVIIIEHGDAPH